MLSTPHRFEEREHSLFLTILFRLDHLSSVHAKKLCICRSRNNDLQTMLRGLIAEKMTIMKSFVPRPFSCSCLSMKDATTSLLPVFAETKLLVCLQKEY